MTAPAAGVSPAWLTLREPADAAARAADLVEEIRRDLQCDRLLTVHDLGCGTGSMRRWLAPQLPGPQLWVMHDRDADLLALADTEPTQASDGSTVATKIRQDDVTRLDRDELAGASLITASALLDLLTADELSRLVSVCAATGCPVLLTLSVIGRVDMNPRHRLDDAVRVAFNAHQRRTAGGRRILGPDAARLAARVFAAHGADVVRRPSLWRLGPASAALTTEWFTGWLGAACEQRPELSGVTRRYARWRLAQAGAGGLRVLVHHHDLLVRPGPPGGTP